MSSAAWIVPLSLAGGYIVISAILLRFPNLLHQKKESKFNARLIAHRGGAGENLENTITAYKHALHTGMDMIEIDCQITKDKKIVVAHDDHLKRITGVDDKISDLDYEDLPPILQNLPVQFCKGQSTCGNAQDRRIPLLREVFQEFPGLPINLDIKRDDDCLINKVLALIDEFKRSDLTPVGNFSDSVVQKCHRRDHTHPLIFSFGGTARLFFLFYTGLLPFWPLKESFLEIPVIDSHIFGAVKVWMKVLVWILDFMLINRILFRHLQRRGIKVYVWVLNDERQFDRALRMGVDGIMTDYPTKLAKYMRKQGLLATNDNDYRTFKDEATTE